MWKITFKLKLFYVGVPFPKLKEQTFGFENFKGWMSSNTRKDNLVATIIMKGKLLNYKLKMEVYGTILGT